MFDHHKLMNSRLFIILVFSLILSSLHSFNELIDDFAYSNVALVEIYKVTGHIIIRPFVSSSGFFVHNVNDLSYRPLSSLLLLILEYISEISARHWVAIPFIGFYGFLVIYLILRIDLKIPLLYAALAAMLGININANVVLGATFYYISIGYAVAFLTLRLLRRYFIENDKKVIKIILLYFIIAPYLYYTASFIISAESFTLILIYYILAKKVTDIKYLKRTKIIGLALVIGLISFLNEKTPYTVLKEYSETFYFLKSIQSIINILNINFVESGYVEYKPVFIHFGYIADLFQKIFIISYLMLFAVSLIYVIIVINKKGFINYMIENATLFAFFVAVIAHIFVYLSIGEINLLMALIFFAIISVTAIRDLIVYIRQYKKNISIHHIAFGVLLLFLLLSTSTAYAKQLIFAEDNIYGGFFTKITNVVYFIDTYTDHSCMANPLKIFMYHHILAYTTYIRVKNNIADCKYPEYILLDEFAPQKLTKYIMLKNINILYVYHDFAPHVRVGAKGVFKNFLIKTIEELNIRNKVEYIYNDKLNIIQAIRT